MVLVVLVKNNHQYLEDLECLIARQVRIQLETNINKNSKIVLKVSLGNLEV